MAFLIADYNLSQESDRIAHPKRNEDKYRIYQEAIVDAFDITSEIGELTATDPDFPTETHLINLRFYTTEIDAVFENDEKGKLENLIKTADSVIIDAPYRESNDVEINLQFNGIYTEGKS